MKLQEGVDLHFIPTDQFTTNRIKIRFAAPMDPNRIAGRVLAANLLEIANQDFPTAQALRKKLAALYGARLSTTVAKRGRTHFVDVTVSYVNAQHLPNREDVTPQILDLLYSCLYNPLVKGTAFDTDFFEIEKKNLLSFLEAEVEDNYYHADVELNKLFFQEEALQIPRVGRFDLVVQETAQTAYQALQDMLKLDKIDIFIVGQVEVDTIVKGFERFSFTHRNPKLELEYHQDYSKITREKVERKAARQSILELGYSVDVLYNDVNYPALMVFNGLFGGFSHSKLFMNVREKESLAYTIGSQLTIFSGMMKVYAGIDGKNRLKTMKLINQQLLDIKKGKVTEEEILLTKNMLIHSARLAQDRPSNLLEQAYNQAVLGERYLTWQEWIEAVNQVSIDDLVRVAHLVRLQAVYFMEGVDK